MDWWEFNSFLVFHEDLFRLIIWTIFIQKFSFLRDNASSTSSRFIDKRLSIVRWIQRTFYVTTPSMEKQKFVTNNSIISRCVCQKCRFVEDISFSLLLLLLLLLFFFSIQMTNSLEKYPFAERILFSADQRVVENHSNYSDRGNALSDHVPRRENEYACRELIRRANESFEVDTRDLSMPWLPGIGIVYVCASCWNVTRLKAIFRARECGLFRFVSIMNFSGNFFPSILFPIF